MGKFVVCARHTFQRVLFDLQKLPNVFPIQTEFAECVREVLHSEPEPISPSDLHRLTWQAATERFLDAAEPDPPEQNIVRKVRSFLGDLVSAKFHNMLTASEAVRVFSGWGSRNPAKARDGSCKLGDLTSGPGELWIENKV